MQQLHFHAPNVHTNRLQAILELLVAAIEVLHAVDDRLAAGGATGDHQRANARGLVEAGAAVLIPETALDAKTLARHIAVILETPLAAETMARNALAVGRPDATDRLMALVEGLAGDAK